MNSHTELNKRGPAVIIIPANCLVDLAARETTLRHALQNRERIVLLRNSIHWCQSLDDQTRTSLVLTYHTISLSPQDRATPM